jgi:hypothetical protein
MKEDKWKEEFLQKASKSSKIPELRPDFFP